MTSPPDPQPPVGRRRRIALPSTGRAGSAAIAAVAALGFGYFAAQQFDTPYLANLAIDASSSVLSPGGLSRVMEIVGELGKAATFAGVLALQFAVYVGIWSLAPAAPGSTLAAEVRDAVVRIAIASALFLALAGFFALAADTPPLIGWEWGELVLLALVEAAAFVGLAFTLSHTLPPLLDSIRRPPVLVPRRVEVVATDTSSGVTRRQFMRLAWVMGAGTASIAAVWYLGRSVAATARTGVVRALDGLWSEEVTATEDFYVVSKNIEGFDPDLSLEGWNLVVDGLVDQVLVLTIADLQTMPVTTGFNTLMCISYRVGGKLISNAGWTGVALRDVLQRAGIDPQTAQVKFTSADDYTESLPLDAALDRDVRLVWLMNGQPLTRKHGFPLRALVPGRYGMKNPKWITRITLQRDEAVGYWAARGWSRSAFIRTMSRFDVPGRNRRIAPGLSPLRGIAFGGDRGISRIEVSIDGGENWDDATVHPPLSDFTWVRWQYDFQAQPPEHALVVRATDGTGRRQIIEARDPLPEGATGYHRRPVRVDQARPAEESPAADA